MGNIALRSIAAFDIAGHRTSPQWLTASDVWQAVSRILKKSPLCAIATVGPDDRAHINTAYFAWSAALELYFLSHPRSLHCRNLQRKPTIAIAVFESAQTWGELDRGLQLFGTCRQARGLTARKAAQAYGGRFKSYRAWRAGLEPDDTAREYRFYRFVTQRLKLFDEREFGGAVFVSAAVRRSAASRRLRNRART
jgi:uncharacterized protein YhbP (UPF0306 family)